MTTHQKTTDTWTQIRAGLTSRALHYWTYLPVCRKLFIISEIENEQLTVNAFCNALNSAFIVG